MAQRVLAARGLATLAVMLVSGALAEPGAWKHPEAAARLRVCVSSAYAHQVRVDLPESLTSTVKGVAAYAPDGGRIAASPIALGERTVGVWLALGRVAQAAVRPGDDGIVLPIEVYLFGEPTIPAPLGESLRRPARLVRTVRALTTRPFTAAEAARLLSSLTGSGRPLYAFDTGGLGDTLESSHGEGPGERRSAVMFWSSALALEAPLRAVFGADSVQAAWFVSVDGRPVAGWRQATAEGSDAFWGPVTELAAGLHSLEYFVIQRHGEALPACLWKPEGQERQPLRGHCPATHPEAVEVQLAAEAQPLGIRLAKVARFVFDGTGADLLCFTPMTAECKPLGQDLSVLLDGQAFIGAEPEACALAAAPRLPQVELRPQGGSGTPAEVRLPARPVWVPPSRMAGTCRVTDLPPVLAASEPLRIEAEVTVVRRPDPDDEVDPRLLGRLSVVARQTDSGGKTLRADRLGPGTGRCSGSLVLDPGTTRVLVEVWADGCVVLSPTPIRLLRGGDDLGGLEALGHGLYQAGEAVVLLCGPMAALPRPAGQASALSWQRLGLLDDLCTAICAPGAALLPEKVLGQSWSRRPAVFRETVPESDSSGALSSVARFPALVRLLEMRPDAVLLLVGAADRRRGRPASETSRDLLFLAQAVSAARALPVLVALPPLPGVAAEESRQAALLCKELAWRLSIPVIDAHSGERLRALAGETFAGTFATPDGLVALAGPNDRGREWLYGLMDEAVADLRRSWRP